MNFITVLLKWQKGNEIEDVVAERIITCLSNVVAEGLTLKMV